MSFPLGNSFCARETKRREEVEANHKFVPRQKPSNRIEFVYGPHLNLAFAFHSDLKQDLDEILVV